GRDDGDVVRVGQVLGDEAAVALGAAGDVGAEAMDDASQLHRRRSIRFRVSVFAATAWRRGADERFRSRGPRFRRTAPRWSAAGGGSSPGCTRTASASAAAAAAVSPAE